MAKAIKASDKQAVCRKLMTALKKRYKGAEPKSDRPVLETLLYAACLENATHEQAKAAYDSLLQSFFDLNEVRVSSITELSEALGEIPEPELRSLWVRSVLQYVFESNYEYQFEKIKRKTLELAARQLGRIPNLTSFGQLYTLQQTMAAFVVPMDDKMKAAAIWLGFVEPGATNEAAADAMKPAVRKSDAAALCHLLRMFANDPVLQVAFQEAAEATADEEYDLMSSPTRLVALFKSPPKPKRKKKATKKKAPAKKVTKKKAKKPAAKAAKKKTTKKTTSRKVVRKVVKKAAAKKKAPAKKKAAKKTTAKKATTKKKAAKKKR